MANALDLDQAQRDRVVHVLQGWSAHHGGRVVAAKDHRQVLDEQTALLVAPTEQALAAGMERLLASPDERKRLAGRALEVAEERYSPALYLERHRKLLAKVFG